MRTVWLCVCATLLLTATVVPDPSANVRQRWDTKGAPRYGADSAAGPSSCALKLKPSGQCGGAGAGGSGAGGTEAAGTECPYQLTLPPLTIQLPKQFRLLEKTLKELQSLKETVDKMKSNCLECRGSGGGGGSRGASGAEAGGFVPQADEGQVPFPGGDAGGSSAGERQEEQLQQAAGPSTEEVVVVRGDGMVTGSAGNGLGSGQGSSRMPLYPGSMLEMQVKMNRMSASLRNARSQISTLQNSLDGNKLLTMEKVQAMVDTRVENISGVVNKLSSTCHKECPQQQGPQFILAPRDCSDYNALDQRKNGVYNVTPDHRNGTFQVFCDMESFGGGWTVIQQRLNGSVSFNRTWAEYKKGFGDFRGEFWLGNDHIHLLTKSKDMILRIELEDFEGVREYAKYDQFYVANEFLRYRLSISGYSGTAGNAISFNKHFNHDQKFFTTPDRDNDMYPSGNCGAYYSSGWWFDACMSANLNGKYYHKRYKGVRNGIFWGTWHNMTTEYYPTNYRQAFKTVKMMIRPKNYAP